MRQGRIFTTNGESFDGADLAYIVIYPNPMNPQKYVVVYSATSSKAMASILKVSLEMESIRPADVAVFEITDAGSVKWHILEKLNTVWAWHRQWDRALVAVNKKHQEWRWRQWAAKAVREQLEVDVVISEDPFIFQDSVPVGEITYGDLFDTFKNVWITVVKIDGKSLRALLTVPFGDISKREVDAPIIEGIDFVKTPSRGGEKALVISELVDDKIYTAALPEKCLNGQRMGVVLDDYTIIDQTYLLPVLREYLESRAGINLDDQLSSLRFKMY
jgi:hypothetical protein